MNTNRTTTPLTTRAAALTVCVIALIAGATACGTQDGTTAPAAIGRHATSEGVVSGSLANQAEYLRQLHAKQVAEAGPRLFGDDRRQPDEPAQDRSGDDRRRPNG
jgi:hypothetical protein